jgi:hypothetical protein
VLVDRVTGLVGLFVVACIGAILSSSTVIRSTIVPLLVVAVCLVCALYLMALPSILRTVVSILGGIGDRYDWLSGTCRKGVDFLSAWAALVSQPRVMLAAIVLGITYQVLAVCINFVVARDLGINIDFSDWCWVLGLVSVALLLPITVAGIGVREGAYAGSLSLLAVPIEQAVVVSIVVFAISLLGALVGAIMELSSPPGARDRT